MSRTTVRVTPARPDAAALNLPDIGDSQNALRFAHMFDGRLLWVEERNQWLWWDDTRWNPDRGGLAALDAAHQVSIAIAEEEASLFKERLMNKAALESMVSLARVHPCMNASEAELDTRSAFLVNCANGTYDLRTRELRDADPADLLTQSTGLAYDPDAECPKFEAHVAWTMQHDPEMIEFLQRAIGYSATGDVSERVLFTAFGEGANGKSVLFEVVKDALGDYAQTAPPGMFEQQRRSGGSASPEFARTRSARLLIGNESEDGAVFSAELVKNLAGGGDAVAARALYREFEEFRPTLKAWVVANHLPKVDADDQAMWTRIRVIPFENSVELHEMNRFLGDELRAELPGILRWIIDGAAKWAHDGGLPMPKKVTVASQEYREAMDVFDDFLEARCTTEGDDLRVTPQQLLDEFHEWARHQRGVDDMNFKTLAAAMKRRGFNSSKSNGKRVYRGITVLPPDFERKIVAESQSRINWQRLLEEAIEPPEDDDDDVALEEHVAPSREAVSPNGDTTTTTTNT